MSKRIEIKDLNIYYGKFHAVKDVSMVVEPRSVTAFIGSSGCGKSTVLRSLNRMHEVIPGAYCTGEVLLDGVDLYDKAVDPVRVRRQVGMVFQRPNPFPTMSIRENVLAGVRLNNSRITRSEADELLEGTFLAARKAYEERKVALLANFYTNIVFRDDIDSGHANYILSLMEPLTYRQLITIFIVGNRQQTAGPLSFVRDKDFRGGETLDSLQVGVLYELFQLAKLDLVVDAGSGYILGVADIKPSSLQLQGTGAQLYNLMTPMTLDFDEYGYFLNAFKPDFLTQRATQSP